MKKNTNLSQSDLMDRFSYDANTGIFTVKTFVSGSRPVGSIAGWVDKRGRGYIRIQINGTAYYAHRLAWLYHYGCFPKTEIDHVNGVRGDNRIKNLRLVDRRGNMKNKRMYKNNTSGAAGVYWYKPTKRWVCYISKGGKLINLGYYINFDEAVSVRKMAEKEYSYHKNHGNPV